MGKRKPRPWPDPPNPLALPVIDNHTHLPVHEGEIPRADGVKMPLEEQLERARQVGVTRMISSACELPTFDPMLELARAHEGVRVALAIHPNEAALHAGCADPSPDGLVPQVREHHIPLDEALSAVEGRLSDPLVVAVGESGLDYFRTADPGREAQKESFRAQWLLATICRCRFMIVMLMRTPLPFCVSVRFRISALFSIVSPAMRRWPMSWLRMAGMRLLRGQSVIRQMTTSVRHLKSFHPNWCWSRRMLPT